jgi:ABC-2 type transport system permease protein
VHKILLIARREAGYNLRRPAYLFSAFGTPLMIVGLWVVILLASAGGEAETIDNTQYGIVQNTTVITEPEPTVEFDDNDDEAETVVHRFTFYETVEAAESALESEAIAAYYVLPQDYRQTGLVERYSLADNVPAQANRALRDVLVRNLALEVDISDPYAGLLDDPVRELRVTLLDTGRELTAAALPVLILTPVFLGIVFFLAIQTTSNFLMNGLVEEKKNRIIEIVMTTVTPFQLLLGKVLGLGALGFIQIFIWVGAALLFFILGPQVEALSFLEDVPLPIDIIVVGLVFFSVAFFLIAGFLSAVGVLAGSEQQSNQYAFIPLIPLYFVPLFTLTEFFTSPDGTVATFLSIFPLTSPLSMIMRMGFTAVPLWQMALSLVLLILVTVLVVYLAARIFRWGLLLYGKTITWRDILNVLRTNGDIALQNTTKEA